MFFFLVIVFLPSSRVSRYKQSFKTAEFSCGFNFCRFEPDTKKFWMRSTAMSPATWRRWRPSLTNPRMKNARGLCFSSRPSSPFTNTWTLQTMKGLWRFLESPIWGWWCQILLVYCYGFFFFLIFVFLKHLCESRKTEALKSFLLCLSVRAVYSDLHNTLMAIDEQEDLRWWKNTYGPGMATDWPHFQVFVHPSTSAVSLILSNLFFCFSLYHGFQEWTPEKKTKKGKKEVEKQAKIEKR